MTSLAKLYRHRVIIPSIISAAHCQRDTFKILGICVVTLESPLELEREGTEMPAEGEYKMQMLAWLLRHYNCRATAWNTLN
jgi:hypothetical protein